jgi:hypothetical protein
LRSSGNPLTIEAAFGDRGLLSLWGGAFYHPVFVDAAARALNLQGQSLSICHGDITGVSNMLFRVRGGVRVATLPLMFQYYGPLFFPGDDHQKTDVEILEPFCAQYDFVYLSLPPQTEIVVAKRWRVFPQVTLAVTAEGLAIWGNGFRDDVKNKIRKAGREKITIATSSTLPITLWNATFERRRLPNPIAASALESWCRSLIDAGLLIIFVAVKDGQAVAFRGELTFGRYAYDWIAGSDPAFHPTGANQLLMAEIGHDLAPKGLAAWDLVGGQIGSIADFKRSFGALEMEHPHLVRARGLKGRLYSLVRGVRHGRA